MNAAAPLPHKLIPTPFVRIGDALAAAMREVPALRPIAKKAEGRRARD